MVAVDLVWGNRRTVDVAGVGVHVLTGINRLTASRSDASGVDASFSQTSEIGFRGTGASAGVLWSPASQISIAAIKPSKTDVADPTTPDPV